MELADRRFTVTDSNRLDEDVRAGARLYAAGHGGTSVALPLKESEVHIRLRRRAPGNCPAVCRILDEINTLR